MQIVRDLLRGPRLRLRLDGRPAKAWSAFVGNGCYGPSLAEPSVRSAADDGVLDVRVVRAGRAPRLQMLVALAARRVGSPRSVDRRTCTMMTIDVAGAPHTAVELDGEPVSIATPLRFESDAGALRVLMPDA
jgi:undecaprenyl-diphosphatase